MVASGVCAGLAISCMVEHSARQLQEGTGPTLHASANQLVSAVQDEPPDHEEMAVRPDL